MSFDIASLHIEESSPEGQAIQTIIDRDQVTPEEAVRRALRQVALPRSTPADLMWGALSSPDDSAILDEAMRFAQERRKLDLPRDFEL